MVPLVPTVRTPPRRISWPIRCTRSNASSGARMASTMRSKPASSCASTPSEDARVTTPSGMDDRPMISGSQAPSGPARPPPAVTGAPPPLSHTSAPPPAPRSRPAQLSTTREASSRGLMSRKAIPVSRRMRARNSGPFADCRQACVATAVTARIDCRAIFCRHRRSASMVRSMAASPRRPVVGISSPRRTTRLKLSMTRNPCRVGVASISRQLLVPRSSAA